MKPSFAFCVLVAAATPAVQAQPTAKPLPEGVTALRNIEYVKNGHERNRLDLYLPKKAEGPLPVIVWVHGGAWLGGSKENPPLLRFVEKGYAVASINYRFSQHAFFPAQIEDCKAAIRWLRAHAKEHNLNPDKIGVAGASAGGHLVALLGTTGGVKELEGSGGNADQSSRVQCVVDLFGPTDLVKMGGTHNNPKSPESRLIGGPVQDNKDKAAKANPINYITKDCPPFLILHGDKDPLVPLDQSEMLAQALKKAGVEATLITIKDAGHGGPAFQSAENVARIEAFFAKHLKDAK